MVKIQSMAHLLRRLLATEPTIIWSLFCATAMLVVGCEGITPDPAPNPASEKIRLVPDEQENGLRRCLWPPPAPSGIYTFDQLQISGRPMINLHEVDYNLTQAIKSAGYSDFCYYALPQKGFAIFTPMEEIDDNGNRTNTTNIYPGKPASISKYIEALFTRPHQPEMHYRAFAFYVTTLGWSNPPVLSLTKNEFDDWTKGGDRTLPQSFFEMKASNYRCYVAVYEFSVKRNDFLTEKEFDRGAPNECRDELQKAGLWQELLFNK
jgi:hypothetical protein